MIIEEDDFKLYPVKDSYRFNLDVKYVVNAGKDNEHSEFKTIAYGISLENAIKYIIAYKLDNKHLDKSITLKEYLQEYKEMMQELHKLYNI
jgi:hypothetical protein